MLDKIFFINMFVLSLVITGTLAKAKANIPRKQLDNFVWKDCGSKPERHIHFKTFNLSPKPLHFPGFLNISLFGQTFKDIHNADVDVKIKKKTMVMDIPIPCAFNVGSCKYVDVCKLVDDGKKLASSTPTDVPHLIKIRGLLDTFECPVAPRTVHFSHHNIPLPPITGAAAMFAKGDFSVHVYIYEHKTQNELGCLELKLTMK